MCLQALSVSGRGHLEALVGVAIAVEARAPTTTDVLARGFAIAEDVHTADNTMRDLHHAIARLQHELQAVALEQQELDRWEVFLLVLASPRPPLSPPPACPAAFQSVTWSPVCLAGGGRGE